MFKYLFYIYAAHVTCSHVIVVMNMCHTMLSFINNFLYVIVIFLIYGIKMIWKLPIILTIQKPNYNRHFSIRGFAAALKPDLFYGKNFLL